MIGWQHSNAIMTLILYSTKHTVSDWSITYRVQVEVKKYNTEVAMETRGSEKFENKKQNG